MSWRAQGDKLDEVVVGKWLHAERMSKRWWWVRIGERTFNVRVDKDGKVKTMMEQDVEAGES